MGRGQAVLPAGGGGTRIKMNEKALRILEYPKIREMLVACAGSFPGRLKCQALLPSQDLQKVQAAA